MGYNILKNYRVVIMSRPFLDILRTPTYAELESLHQAIAGIKKVKGSQGPIQVTSSLQLKNILDYSRYESKSADFLKEFSIEQNVLTQRRDFLDVVMRKQRVKELIRFEYNAGNAKDGKNEFLSILKETGNVDQEAQSVLFSLILLEKVHDVFFLERCPVSILPDHTLPLKYLETKSEFGFSEFLVVKKILANETELKILEHILREDLVTETLKKQLPEVAFKVSAELYDKAMSVRRFELEASSRHLWARLQAQRVLSWDLYQPLDSLTLVQPDEENAQFEKSLRSLRLGEFLKPKFRSEDYVDYSQILDSLIILGLMSKASSASIFGVGYDETPLTFALSPFDEVKFLTILPPYINSFLNSFWSRCETQLQAIDKVKAKLPEYPFRFVFSLFEVDEIYTDNSLFNMSWKQLCERVLDKEKKYSKEEVLSIGVFAMKLRKEGENDVEMLQKLFDELGIDVREYFPKDEN